MCEICNKMTTIEKDNVGIILQPFSKYNGNILLSDSLSHIPKELIEEAIQKLQLAKKYAR